MPQNDKEQERKDALDRFRKAFPGVWEQMVELFGEWPKPAAETDEGD